MKDAANPILVFNGEGGESAPVTDINFQKFPASYPEDAKGIWRGLKQESAGKIVGHDAIPFAIQDSFIRVCDLHRYHSSAGIEMAYAVSML